MYQMTGGFAVLRLRETAHAPVQSVRQGGRDRMSPMHIESMVQTQNYNPNKKGLEQVSAL